MLVENTQQFKKKIPNKNIVGDEFIGRPDIDKGTPSDPERQFQREMQPYGQRYFEPDSDKGYNNDFKQISKEIFAGGSVKGDGTPFFRVHFKETLNQSSRERELVVCDKNGEELFKISDKGAVYLRGQNLEGRLNDIEIRLTNAGF